MVLLHADEGVMLSLERNWEKISLQTGWDLETRTRPSDALGTTSVHHPNNSYSADTTPSPMGDVLENDKCPIYTYHCALTICHLFLSLSPLSVIQYQLLLLIDLLKPSHKLLVISQLLLQIKIV